MFKNKMINGYTYATRYIASWLRSGGKLRCEEDYDKFRDWLESLGLESSEIHSIYYLASNGKMELEISAEEYIQNMNN